MLSRYSKILSELSVSGCCLKYSQHVILSDGWLENSRENEFKTWVFAFIYTTVTYIMWELSYISKVVFKYYIAVNVASLAFWNISKFQQSLRLMHLCFVFKKKKETQKINVSII